jgi:hypothetical protein
MLGKVLYGIPMEEDPSSSEKETQTDKTARLQGVTEY